MNLAFFHLWNKIIEIIFLNHFQTVIASRLINKLLNDLPQIIPFLWEAVSWNDKAGDLKSDILDWNLDSSTCCVTVAWAAD